MKQTVLICAMIFGLLSSNCRTQTQQATQIPIPDSIQKDSSKMECLPVPYRYRYGHGNCWWRNFAPGTFVEITNLYNSTKPDAQIIDTLQFNTLVNILAEHPEYFLICTPKGKSGYVRKTDLYLYQILGKSNNYMFGIINYETIAQTSSCSKNILKVAKINPDHRILSTCIDTILRKDFEIQEINISALKNAEALFYLSYHCYGGQGVGIDHFIVDNGKQLLRLILTTRTGDGGDAEISTTYLPVRLKDGVTIVLAKNGVLSVNELTGKVENYPYPEDSGIPIEELIIVVDEVLEQKKTYVIQTSYYQWTGTELREVKTIKGK